MANRTFAFMRLAGLVCVCVIASGCSLIPDIKHKPQYLNPFPQIRSLAVLPFVNQSEEPTLSGDRVASAYINELQSIPGFEVMPLGIVKERLAEYRQPLASGEDFQAFARYLGVDAVLLGSVTDFNAYYPPRMSLKVNWYAANPGFHPVLPGYGLPWGTQEEKKIPRWIHHESQRALAHEQMKSQTPDPHAPMVESVAPGLPVQAPPSEAVTPVRLPEDNDSTAAKRNVSLVQSVSVEEPLPGPPPSGLGHGLTIGEGAAPMPDAPPGESLPMDWPDARGFIPNPPSTMRPAMLPQHEPIISHMRNYNGHDEDFTQRLSDYFYFRDDARFGGWQSYLQRSEDFIRVCCYFHLTETLACRGGEDESRLILRWPIDRYQR